MGELPVNFKTIDGALVYTVRWAENLAEIHYSGPDIFDAFTVINGSPNHACLLSIEDKEGRILDQYVSRMLKSKD